MEWKEEGRGWKKRGRKSGRGKGQLEKLKL